MFNFIRKNKYNILLWTFIIAYIIYFSFFTIIRYKTLYSSYFDLGIMHQTVHNTFKAIVERDWSRILELTNPNGPEQIKRMGIHNDIILAFLAPFYFIHDGPETLLIIQSIVLALGAWAVFNISKQVLAKLKHAQFLSLIFAFAYLMYTPMQRANVFEFHSVTLSTSFLLFMFYLFLTKRYFYSLIFFILSLLSKEQVALTTLFFGLYSYFFSNPKEKASRKYGLAVIICSLIWFILSVYFIIPQFRGSKHFALSYYGDFGETPIGVIIGIVDHPYSVIKYIFQVDSLRYFFFLLGSLGFLSILSPIQLLIALPEFAVNILSNDPHMKNIIFHYTSVIQPFVFISAIYGVKKIITLRKKITVVIVSVCLIAFTLIFSYFKGPLPYSREQEIHPFIYPQKETKEVLFWAKTLKDEKLKIATTGQLAPFFTSRRYFYEFSKYYYLADYIILRTNEIYNYPEKDILIPIYAMLQKDRRYEIIYKNGVLEVYKRV